MPHCVSAGLSLPPPCSYCPNTIDINTDEAEYRWLLQVLEDQVRPGGGGGGGGGCAV